MEDIAVLTFGRMIQESARAAEKEVNEISKYGEENRIAFAPEKIEAMHITRGSEKTNPPIRLCSDIFIHPTPLTEAADGTNTGSQQGAKPVLRRLGVHFDKKLKFKWHVAIRAAKATQVTSNTKSLAATNRGPPADSLHKSFRRVLQPVVLYSSKAWYKGGTASAKQMNKPGPRLVSTYLWRHMQLI